MPKSNQKVPGVKPAKPRPDFPLFAHNNGRWAKKIRQRLHYFGKWADDPKGVRALEAWLDQKDDLLAGRAPTKVDPNAMTVMRLCNHFLTHKKSLLEAGEIVGQTFREYHATCERLLRVFGRETLAEGVQPGDFQKLRNDIVKNWGPVRLGNEITRIKGIFRHGYEAGLLSKPPLYGPGFKKPSAKVLRQNRAKRGLRMFERRELEALLKIAPPTLKAMILLGINAGFGNNDVATLPIKAVDLDHGWIDYPRPKTGVGRRVPLWPETIEALRTVLENRPKPTDKAFKELVFISPTGLSFISKDSGHRIAKILSPVMEEAGIARPGLSFYALRHTFQTVAEGARDMPSVRVIMGHAAAQNDMGATYRERVDDERLKAVTNYVRKWLWPKRKKG